MAKTLAKKVVIKLKAEAMTDEQLASSFAACPLGSKCAGCAKIKAEQAKRLKNAKVKK